MTLTLVIENAAILEGGAPARIEVPPEGLSAGRSGVMGWVLPDPSRHISGHHFDVWRDAQGWWLHDLSTNGTFLQGHRHRLGAPHRLAHGDRFQVGPYIIVAMMPAEPSMAPVPPLPGLVRSQPPQPAQSARGGPSLPDRGGRPLQEFARDILAAAPAARQALAAPPEVEGDARREITGIRPSLMTGPRADVVTAFCDGAGLAPDLYGKVDAAALAQMLGQTLRIVSDQVMHALQDRAAAKQFARTGERTLQGAQDNNPLKFLPDAGQAIEAMFLNPRPGFSTGAAPLTEAMAELRAHQAAMFAALQPALARLLADLNPEDIEAEAELTRAGGNRAARAWEIFAARWAAKAEARENGLLDEFLDEFAACYRDLTEPPPSGAPGPG